MNNDILDVDATSYKLRKTLPANILVKQLVTWKEKDHHVIYSLQIILFENMSCIRQESTLNVVRQFTSRTSFPIEIKLNWKLWTQRTLFKMIFDVNWTQPMWAVGALTPFVILIVLELIDTIWKRREVQEVEWGKEIALSAILVRLNFKTLLPTRFDLSWVLIIAKFVGIALEWKEDFVRLMKLWRLHLHTSN